MNEMDVMLAKYVEETIPKMRGQPITSENYLVVVEHLREEERQSYGIIKRSEIIKFLEEWFS